MRRLLILGITPVAAGTSEALRRRDDVAPLLDEVQGIVTARTPAAATK